MTWAATITILASTVCQPVVVATETVHTYTRLTITYEVKGYPNHK